MSIQTTQVPILPRERGKSKFRLIFEIGHGGMSEVHLALVRGGMDGFRKLVVLKLLRKDLSADEEFLRMFLEEAKLAAQANHPNVVQTYDVGEELGRHYISMEYLEGQTFSDVRAAAGKITDRKIFTLHMQIRMLVDVLSGLHYVHEMVDYDGSPLGVVHRDVTPSNVFITYDGQVKLMDFGIAKLAAAESRTRAGIVKGKMRYMAAEQIAGGTLDRRADVFAVGAMLWETLAGRNIWRGVAEADVFRRVSRGDLPGVPIGAPERLREICSRAMSHHAKDRYPTAEAMGLELEEYLAQFATPSRGRTLGAAVGELFRDERSRVRDLIATANDGHSFPSISSLSREGTRLSSASFGTLLAETSESGSSGSSGSSMASNLLMSRQKTTSAMPAMPAMSGQESRESAPVISRSHVGRWVALAILSIAIGSAVAFLVLRPNMDSSRRISPTSIATPATAPEKAPEAVRGVTDRSILLGMSSAFSGASRDLGSRMKLGLDTAFAVLNESGIAGRRIDFQALDDGYEGKRALANVTDLISTRGAFAIIGDVGTPTALEAQPYVTSTKTIFFGAFTGSSILRRDPPDRYVFNYRASYEEETGKMIDYLLNVRKINDKSIVVFAQHDSYGDSGYAGAQKMLRKRGRSDDLLRVGYERNSIDIDDAVVKIAEYNSASFRAGDSSRLRHPVKAIIMIGTYKPCAKFIQRIVNLKIDAIFLNVSFVGSDSLAEELHEMGPGYGTGVIVTQVVPHFQSGATGAINYREALSKYHPDQNPDFVSFEGYTVGLLFGEGLRRAGRDLTTEKLIGALEQMRGYDPGLGGPLEFGVSQHQASHRVWGTIIDEHGQLIPLDMD